MIVRRILIAVFVVGAVAAVAIWLLLKYAPDVTLTFNQEEVQRQIAPRFPAKKCFLGPCIELTNPRIGLLESNNQVSIEFEFVATLGNRTMPGTAKLEGRPHYDPNTGNFYLHDVKVPRFTMSGNAPDFDEVVKVRGPSILAALIGGIPLYSVQSHPKYGSIAKHTLKSIRVYKGQMEVVFANPLLLLDMLH